MRVTPTPGLQALGVDVFVKVGGSLLRHGVPGFTALSRALGDAARDQRVVAFPGGGPIDDYIEELDREVAFAPVAHHHLCARAQDQTGLVLASLCPDADVFAVPLEARPLLDAGRLAVMLPMRLIVDLDVFEQTWEITSDTMAAWFAAFFEAERFAILTDVDGVRPPDRADGPPLPEVSASELKGWGATCVDACLAPLLLRTGMEAHIVNGTKPDAVSRWVATGEGAGTIIRPE
jgi:aspartokinase-like uncharacterized kinase